MDLQGILDQYQDTPWQTAESQESTLLWEAEQFMPSFAAASVEEKKQFITYFLNSL